MVLSSSEHCAYILINTSVYFVSTKITSAVVDQSSSRDWEWWLCIKAGTALWHTLHALWSRFKCVSPCNNVRIVDNTIIARNTGGYKINLISLYSG